MSFFDPIKTNYPMMVGVPSVMAAGFVIHFFLGIKLVPNVPTLRELLSKR